MGGAALVPDLAPRATLVVNDSAVEGVVGVSFAE